MARSTDYDALTGAKVRNIDFIPYSFEGDEVERMTITFEDGRWLDLTAFALFGDNAAIDALIGR